ncbi:MAG: MFS transporter [Acidimicrobiales bacterium]
MAEQRQAPLPGLEDLAPQAPTEPSPAVSAPGDRPGLHVRMFGSSQFFRLWLSQVLSSIGDWLGFFAIAALATRVGAGSPEAAVGVVMSARIIPGFFLGATSGVFADRFDRKRLMVGCNIGRALVLMCLPFVDTVFGLVFASLLLECFALLWTPAKEASVPNLVPPDHLTTANSLSLVAAYGTMPISGAIFSVLASVSKAVGEIDALDSFRTNQEAIAFYVNAAAFIVAAVMISRLQLPRHERRPSNGGRRVDFGEAFHELKEGWSFIFINPVVRAVNVGLATGLIGGGMLVPLGPVFSETVLDAGAAGFGILIFALGTGVALGVIVLSVFQRHIPKPQVFAGSVLGAGISLLVAASMSSLGFASLFVGALGVCAGSVYVLGFTLLHENVDDELRGRIFSALYTLVRFCVLVAFAVGPFLSGLLDRFSTRAFEGEITVAGVSIAVPGVRLTLWLAGLIIIGAGFLALASVRAATSAAPMPRTASALDELLLHEGAELVSGMTGPFAEVRRSHGEPPPRGISPAPGPEQPVPDDSA